MILVGNRRGGAAECAQHLMNVVDNDHVHIHELRGFLSSDLDGAFHEAYGISRGTRCKKFLYSLSLSPPETESVSMEVFEAAIEEIETKLGFVGHPRAIVFHEKKGRRHAHCVWSRINSATMTAIDPYQDKLMLEQIARELFIEHKWDMPPGFKRREDTDPLNYSHAQHSQAKRAKRDPKELKCLFADCWQASDSRAAFEHALSEHGFILAKGDRRAHVAVDRDGEVYSISRWVGVKAKEVRTKLGDYHDLPSIEEALEWFEKQNKQTTTNPDAELAYRAKLAELEQRRIALVAKHRSARTQLTVHHSARRIRETKLRQDRLPRGLKAAWLKLSGRYQSLCSELEAEVSNCDMRDRAEYQDLIERQLLERRALQRELENLEHDHETRSPAFDLDSAHELIIPVDPEALSIKAKVNRDPAYILEVLTDKQESFTRNDVIRGLVKYLDDPLLVSGAIDNITRSPDWIEIQTESSPLFTTHKMLAMKTALVDHILNLSKTTDKGIPSRHINAAITRQNRVLEAKIGASLSTEQETAIRHCLKPARISAVVGLAGAGKSTMLSAVKQAYEKSGYRVRGAALSGKATDGLESASGIRCRTLASFEYSWKNGFNQLTSNDVLIIDEAGMVGTRQLLRFVEEVQKTGAKIILVGDPEQLQPINAGTPFKDIADKIDTAQLTEIHRQKSAWQRQASLDFAQRRVEQALNAYEVHGLVKEARDTSSAILNLVEDYIKDISNDAGASSRLALAYRRKDVHTINQSIRAALKDSGELKHEVTVQTIHGKRAFASKDRMMFTKKDRALGILNGIFGTVQSVSENKITVLVDADGSQGLRTVTFNPKLYPHFDHGYASTIHKSQSATIDRTFVLGSPLMDRHLTYVAMTRHRDETTLYGDRVSIQKMRRSGEEKSSNHRRNSNPTSRQTRGPTMH